MRQIPFFFIDSQVHVVSLPPWGKVAPQGRMRGKLSSAIRLRVMLGNFALISPLRGQLPPMGKPFCGSKNRPAAFTPWGGPSYFTA